jgi:hypothetical protein
MFKSVIRRTTVFSIVVQTLLWSNIAEANPLGPTISHFDELKETHLVTSDAALNISSAAVPCETPTSVSISDIDAISAEISWTSNGSESLWNIELVNLTDGDTATGVATFTGVTDNPYDLSGLSPETEYAILVQADCGPLNTPPVSDWSVAATFTTLPTCLPLGSISIDSVSDTGLWLSWSQAGSETAWDVELINLSNTPADTFTYTPNYDDLGTNTPSFTGLDPESDYQFIVRADCGGLDGESAWTSVYSFTTLPTCQAPIDLVSAGYTNDEITFSWTAVDTETMWYIEYVNVTLGEIPTGVADDSTFTTSYTATNLASDSEYDLYVSAACGGLDGNSDWAGPITITTLCDPVAIPYNLVFDVWPPECVNLNGGTATFSQFSNTAGDYAEADFWSVDDADYYMTLPIISMSQSAILSFEWSHSGDYAGDYPFDALEVFVSSDDGVTWNSIWVKVGSDFASNDGAGTNSPGTFVQEELLLDVAEVGTSPIIRFIAHSDYGPDLFIKSVSVDHLPDCNVPYYVTIDSMYTNSADVSFTVAGTGATLYNIEVVESGNSPTGVPTQTETGSPFTVSGLAPGTDYQIFAQTVCGIDSSTWVGPISFTTVCAPVADYYTGFEGEPQGSVPNCWNFINNTSSTWSSVEIYDAAWAAHTGTGSIFINNDYSVGNDQEQLIVFPEFNNVSAGTHRVRFWATDYYNSGNAEAVVGTMSDPTDPSTFSSIEVFDLTDQYIQYTVNYDDYTGSDTYVAIRFDLPNSYTNVFVDDVEWHEIPNCFPPSLTINGTTTSSVTATLDTIGTFGSEWYIEMVDAAGINPTVFDTVSTLSFTTSGLMSSTQYEMIVSSSCGAETSEGVTYEFVTDCAPIGNFFADFETYDNGDTAVCWDYTVVTTSTSQWDYPRVQIGESTWASCSGARYIGMYNGDDPNAELFLVTPELNNINAGTNMLTFGAKSSWLTIPFEVGTMTDASDPSTFTSLYSGTADDDNICDSVTVPFINYTGTDTRIAIRFSNTNLYSELYIDKVSWEPAPDCAMPVGFNAVNITDEEVTLDWLEISADTVWHLELVDVLSGTSVYDSIPTDTAYAHPFVIDGLQENTLYDVYLSNPCFNDYTAIQTSFVTPWINDVGVSAILSPASEACNLSDSTQIEVEITNYGGQYQTGFPVELSWDNTNYVNVGTFTDTLWPGTSASFTIDGYYNFETAIDSTIWIQTTLGSDSVLTNNSNSLAVTNLGDMYIDIQINTGEYAGEVFWNITDTVNNITAIEIFPYTYNDYTTHYYTACVYSQQEYVMSAWDDYGDGWNGGTYSITRCGGIILANNNGNEVTNFQGDDGSIGTEMEVQEGFIIEHCPDDDLAVLAIDGLESECELGMEVGNVTVMNFGNNDVAPFGATVQYQFNNSGLWIDFWDFDTGLASQQDTVLEMPAVNMGIAGTYTIDIQVVFALDEDLSTNFMSEEVTSVPTLTEDSTTFNDDNGGWTSHLINGVNNSWEYGIPTTANIGNGNDQEIWATNLTGNAALNELSYLLSPCYDFSSYTEDAEIKFDFVRTNIYYLHSFELQSSIDGGATWQFVWFAPYDTPDWTEVILVADGTAGESDVKFRWRHESSYFNPIEGFGFDNWEVYEHEPYTDASLSDLTVNNNTVTDPVVFDPTVFDYNYAVPYGSTSWNVGAVVNAPFYTSIDIDQVASLPGIATVTVVAEDENYSSVYTVNISEIPPATDATLSALTVSNNSVPGFHPDTLCYTVVFPIGSTFQPNVDATPTDPNATVVINNTNIPGTCTIEVTAEDGITTNTYCIVYEEEQQSSDAYLSDLLVDGTTVPGFNSDTLDYYMEVPNGTAVVPTVAYVTADANATVNLVNGTIPFPTETTVTVTAQDGVTVIVYTVHFTEAASDDATLLDLTINGSTVIGFDPLTNVYNVEIPYNSAVPTVVGTPNDSGADVVVTDATAVPGTTIIEVTAEDGVTVNTYYINWSYAPANDDASLASAVTDFGALCPNFDPDIFDYTIVVPSDAIQIALLTLTTNDPNATITTSQSPTGPTTGSYTIVVTAEDGTTSQTYTFTLTTEWCLGIAEELSEKITVSPNPSSGIFTISTSTKLNDFSMEVIDHLGKVLYSSESLEDIQEHVLDLSDLPSGMYNLRIKAQNTHIVKRISIIQ